MKLRPKFDTAQWAEDNFRDCDLGDRRRSQRLVTMARQIADRPAASLPKIGEDWGGAKAIYRLLDRDEATLESVTRPHRRRVTSQKGKFLILSDTTHVGFGKHRALPDAGPISRGKNKGFLLHSGLLIDTSDHSLTGLAGQVAHVRKASSRNKKTKADKWRESAMWTDLITQVGPPPEGSQYIHVCDSAADNFDVFCTVAELRCDFLIRVGRQHRIVELAGEEMPLSTAVSAAAELGTYTLEIGRGNGRKARSAQLQVSAVSLEIPVPLHRTKRAKAYLANGGENIAANLIVVQEIDPPAGVEPIRWLLLTTLPIATFADAREVIGWYEDRWLIEEWHKALKTGCRLESRQLQSVDRLLALTGMLSVVAVLLVQLKSAARTTPNRPAEELVPPLWLNMLKAKRKITARSLTSYEFWRELAKLGGFLGRRHDGEPGWQTIWRGWQELHQLVEGARLGKRCG